MCIHLKAYYKEQNRYRTRNLCYENEKLLQFMLDLFDVLYIIFEHYVVFRMQNLLKKMNYENFYGRKTKHTNVFCMRPRTS